MQRAPAVVEKVSPYNIDHEFQAHNKPAYVIKQKAPPEPFVL